MLAPNRAPTVAQAPSPLPSKSNVSTSPPKHPRATPIPPATGIDRRTALATTLLTLVSASSPAHAETPPTTVYFGNGCFWGRQKDFVDVEQGMLKRSAEQTSAVVGYAGGRTTSPDGKVCYYYSKDPANVYERLGHAEVVQLQLDAGDEAKQMQMFAERYFSQFKRSPFGGMQRLVRELGQYSMVTKQHLHMQDPQDKGPGYRNVVGIPGGMDSPLYPAFAAANKNGMKLVRGSGNELVRGRPTEDDVLNTVYVVDSTKLPFFPVRCHVHHRAPPCTRSLRVQAEQYHQFHNGIGAAFPKEYTRDLKRASQQAGRIGPTGCPEAFLF